MAAATVTRTLAVGREHRITVTSTGGAGSISTIALVYAAVVAILPTAMSYDNGTNTYTLHRLTAGFSSFYIILNCTVLIPANVTFVNLGKATDSLDTVFYLYEGGKLICNPGSKITFADAGGYLIFYGSVLAIGTADNPVIFLKYRWLYLYHRNPSIYEYVTFKNIHGATYPFLYLTHVYAMASVQFRNIKFTNDSHNKWGYCFNVTNGVYTNVLIDGILCDYVYALLNVPSAASFKIKNGIVTNCGYSTAAAYIQAPVMSLNTYLTTKDDTKYQTKSNQPIIWVLNILFDAFGGTTWYAFNATNAATVYVKHCTFSCTTGSSTYCGLYSQMGSYIILNDNDYSGILANNSRKVWGTNGTILHGKELDLTVVDNNSNALLNASVTIYQSDYKLKWNFITDINGKVNNMFGDNIILINKEESSLNTFDIWCDTADTSSYHYIVTSYPGYITNTTRIDTNIDNNITIRLTPIKTQIQPGDERMLYLIVELLKTALLTIELLSFIGYYPYDYGYINNRLPCVLIKFGNTNVSSPYGLHTYDVVATTLFILYSNKGIELSLDIELSIIIKIIETLHNNSTYCINGIADTAVLAGEINEYISPDTTGYNANILVRKIIQSYSFQKII